MKDNTNIYLRRLGKLIKDVRKSKGLTQMDLAFSMDMSMNTISYIELGKIAPKIDTLLKIAKVLNMDLKELIPNSIETKDKIQDAWDSIQMHQQIFYKQHQYTVIGIIKSTSQMAKNDQGNKYMVLLDTIQDNSDGETRGKVIWYNTFKNNYGDFEL